MFRRWKSTKHVENKHRQVCLYFSSNTRFILILFLLAFLHVLMKYFSLSHDLIGFLVAEEFWKIEKKRNCVFTEADNNNQRYDNTHQNKAATVRCRPTQSKFSSLNAKHFSTENNKRQTTSTWNISRFFIFSGICMSQNKSGAHTFTHASSRPQTNLLITKERKLSRGMMCLIALPLIDRLQANYLALAKHANGNNSDNATWAHWAPPIFLIEKRTKKWNQRNTQKRNETNVWRFAFEVNRHDLHS